MDFEKYSLSPFRQSIIVFYRDIGEFNRIMEYFLTERGDIIHNAKSLIGFLSSETLTFDGGNVTFNDGSIIRLYDIKDFNRHCYNFRWTSIMVTSGCTKKDIENLNKSTLLGFIYGSYANANIMRIEKPENIFVGATPVKYER